MFYFICTICSYHNLQLFFRVAIFICLKILFMLVQLGVGCFQKSMGSTDFCEKLCFCVLNFVAFTATVSEAFHTAFDVACLLVAILLHPILSALIDAFSQQCAMFAVTTATQKPRHPFEFGVCAVFVIFIRFPN